MTADLLMPKLGLTMTEGVLLEWKVAPGDRFAKGDVLFVVETDKAATDIEADADGALGERLVAEGETVPVGTPVGRLAGAGTAGAPASSKPEVAPPPAQPAATEPTPASRQDIATPQRQTGRIVATPLARRLARERGIDLARLSGSGPRGRIKAVDLDGATTGTPSGASAGPVSETSRSRPTPMQAAMARRLSAVKQGVPHFYLSTEVEVSALAALRTQLNGDPDQQKLTLTHFLLAAVGRALLAQPAINRVWDEGEILTYGTTAVSMAVETENGLYVPVVRDCGTVSLDAIAGLARTAIDKARRGRLAASEMEGAAIAVSNAGMHDVTWLTPIINPGQSAILGVGSVREVFRPDAHGRPALRREMGLVFSGDHRVHTGVEGLAFLNAVKTFLENPARLLKRG